MSGERGKAVGQHGERIAGAGQSGQLELGPIAGRGLACPRKEENLDPHRGSLERRQLAREDGVRLLAEEAKRDPLEVAPRLLGCVLAHETREGLVTVTLTEVEAYEGQADPASHAYRGRTSRNAVMFGEPGHAYVYFTYGMHFCVNLVCLPEGTASAVLLRAGRVTDGVALAAARRMAGRNGARQVAENDLARGPSRLCQALGIDRSFDGADVCDPASELRILPSVLAGSGQDVPHISQGPRVGISVVSHRSSADGCYV